MKKMVITVCILFSTVIGIIFSETKKEDPINSYITCIGESSDAGKKSGMSAGKSDGTKIIYGTALGAAGTFGGMVDCLDGKRDWNYSINSKDDSKDTADNQ